MSAGMLLQARLLGWSGLTSQKTTSSTGMPDRLVRVAAQVYLPNIPVIAALRPNTLISVYRHKGAHELLMWRLACCKTHAFEG